MCTRLAGEKVVCLSTGSAYVRPSIRPSLLQRFNNNNCDARQTRTITDNRHTLRLTTTTMLWDNHNRDVKRCGLAIRLFVTRLPTQHTVNVRTLAGSGTRTTNTVQHANRTRVHMHSRTQVHGTVKPVRKGGCRCASARRQRHNRRRELARSTTAVVWKEGKQCVPW